MRDGWSRQLVRDVVEQVKRAESLQSDKEYQLLGVRWYAGGPFARESVSRESSKANRVYRVEAGDFIYNRLFAWKGSFGVVSAELAGSYVSGEFPVFVADQKKVLPEYLFHYMARPAIWDQILLESTGSTATSRNRWKEDRFLASEIDLPPVQEQRRIVDLIASIDSTIERGLEVIAVVEQATAALLSRVFAPWPESSVKLGDLVVMSSGPSWAASQESTEPSWDTIPVLKITNTKADGSLDLTEVAHVSGLPSSTRRLAAGDLVLIRTNGNKSRIGNIYRIGTDAIGCTYSAFQIGLFPKDEADSPFIYWTVRAPWVQSAITEAASGSTGLGNIAISWLRELPVWKPPLVEVQKVVAMFDEFAAEHTTTQALVRRLQDARTQILSSLLSGSQEIPASYDRFLEAAS